MAFGVASVVLSLATLAIGRPDYGVTLGHDGDYIRIVNVREGSPAWADGLRASMIVVSLNGRDFVQLPQLVPADEAAPTETPPATPSPSASAVSSPAPSASAVPSPAPSASAPSSMTPGASAMPSPSPVVQGGASAGSSSGPDRSVSPAPSPTPAPSSIAEASPPVASTVPSQPPATVVPAGFVLDPPSPVALPLQQGEEGLLVAPVRYLSAIDAHELAIGGTAPGEWNVTSTFVDSRYQLDSTAAAFGAGLAILIGGLWWLASRLSGPTLRPLAAPLAVATSLPFLLQPLVASTTPGLVLAARFLQVGGMTPLAHALAERVDDPPVRWAVRLAWPAFAVAAAAVGALRLLDVEASAGITLLWIQLVAAVAALPAFAAAVRLGGSVAQSRPESGVLPSLQSAVGRPDARSGPRRGHGRRRRLRHRSGGAVAGDDRHHGSLCGPPAGAPGKSGDQLQRDLVVAATEAERARVAADIHDDALQELTLLVRRLDAAGDAEGAEIARGVSDRLRAICGDLRLPILDDLGVGPALDWLVLRIERLAGGEVRLERAEGVRPPADVELAIFRVAQEALGNAVKHGRPPIIVRYRSSGEGRLALRRRRRPGHRRPTPASAPRRAATYGLLNMHQRAEADRRDPRRRGGGPAAGRTSSSSGAPGDGSGDRADPRRDRGRPSGRARRDGGPARRRSRGSTWSARRARWTRRAT